MHGAGVAIVVAVAAAACVAGYVSHREAIRRAVEAVERADEYWASGELLFEPRLREAETAVAEVGTWPSELPHSTLNLCLATEKASRAALSYRETAASIAVNAVTREYGAATGLMFQAALEDGKPASFDAEASMEKKYAAFVDPKTKAYILETKEAVERSKNGLADRRNEMTQCIAGLKQI